MSLRIRLTLLYSLLFAVLIAAFGTIVYLQTSKRLYESVDDTLRTRAERVVAESSDASDTNGTVAADQSVLDEITSPGVYVEILKQDGTVVARSSNLSAQLPVRTSRRPTSSSPSFETHQTRENGERVRVLYEDIPLTGGDQGRLLVARSLHPTDAALDRIRIILIGGGAAFLIVANALAYVVASPALRPLRDATDTAAEIEATADFSRRISGKDQRGEVGDLVRTLNELIAKVETTLDAHRAFLADSSHELRRPLAVLRGNLEMLGSHALREDEQQQIIAETDAESRRMSRILSDLLLLSQVDARMILQLQPIDLNDLLTSVTEHERQRFPAREINFDMASGSVRVDIDEQRVRQVFENLLENAARYSDPAMPINVSVRRNGRVAHAAIRDEGPGMSDDEVRHAFERFFRGRRGRRQFGDGSGLGLAIVRHISEAHGGGVALTSSEAGTTVTVELPLSAVNL
ncbi:MAG: HAMP domain-containing histidine kinase [Chloroflexota bacterium]|nr:HAMP domain-containing histidine kinase [Chloroflexota bacterium]